MGLVGVAMGFLNVFPKARGGLMPEVGAEDDGVAMGFLNVFPKARGLMPEVGADGGDAKPVGVVNAGVRLGGKVLPARPRNNIKQSHKRTR